MHDLEKVHWCDENEILRPEQNKKGRRHPFQLSRERKSGNDPNTQFFLRMANPWNNLRKKHCTCTLGELFQEQARLVLEQSR